jgi:hypothetical protein
MRSRLAPALFALVALVAPLLSVGSVQAEERPLLLAVDLSLGRAGFGKLDFTEAEGTRLEADGIGVQAGVDLVERRGHLRWGIGLDSTAAAGGGGTSVQAGLAAHVGFTSRYIDVIAGSGFGVLWITDRRDRQHVDYAVPIRFELGVRITRTLAVVPQASVYLGRRAMGAFIGGGVQWMPGA